MKILFSGNTAWSMYNFRRKIFESCMNDGMEVVVTAPYDEVFSKKIVKMGCKFIPVDISRKGTNPMQDYRLYKNYIRILKEEKPDGCFFYTIKPNIYGGMAAGKLNIPFITITTGLGYIFNNENIVSKIAKKLYNISFRKARMVWFLNRDDINSFLKERIIPEKKAMLLNGEGIDTEHFTVSHAENGSFSFILIARMLWDKGVGLYVDAAKELKKRHPEVEFRLLGAIDKNNPMGIPLETIMKWHNEGVINYMGEVQDVRPYINSSSCVVLPSFYREGIPFCLMEGAASGKPIITTDNVGCREVIKDGYNGFMCKIKDKESLIEAMEKMVSLPLDERIRMGENGRDLMKNEFDIKLIVKEYKKAIRENFTSL